MTAMDEYLTVKAKILEMFRDPRRRNLKYHFTESELRRFLKDFQEFITIRR